MKLAHFCISGRGEMVGDSGRSREMIRVVWTALRWEVVVDGW